MTNTQRLNAIRAMGKNAKMELATDGRTMDYLKSMMVYHQSYADYYNDRIGDKTDNDDVWESKYKYHTARVDAFFTELTAMQQCQNNEPMVSYHVTTLDSGDIVIHGMLWDTFRTAMKKIDGDADSVLDFTDENIIRDVENNCVLAGWIKFPFGVGEYGENVMDDDFECDDKFVNFIKPNDMSPVDFRAMVDIHMDNVVRELTKTLTMTSIRLMDGFIITNVVWNDFVGMIEKLNAGINLSDLSPDVLWNHETDKQFASLFQTDSYEKPRVYYPRSCVSMLDKIVFTSHLLGILNKTRKSMNIARETLQPHTLFMDLPDTDKLPLENGTVDALTYFGIALDEINKIMMVPSDFNADEKINIVKMALDAWDNDTDNDYMDKFFNDDDFTDYVGTYVIAWLEHIKKCIVEKSYTLNGGKK